MKDNGRMTTSQYIDDMQREADEAMDEEYEADLAWQDWCEGHMDDEYDPLDLPDEVGLSEMLGVPMFTL